MAGRTPEPRSAHCRRHDVHRLLPEARCGPRQLHHGRARIHTGLTTVGQAGATVGMPHQSCESVHGGARPFRSMKSVDLKARPIYVLLCTPAYYVEWHMRAGAGCYSAMRPRCGRKAGHQPSGSGTTLRAVREKVASKQTTDGSRVHSFWSLLADLGTLTRHRILLGEQALDRLATPPGPAAGARPASDPALN
jgi:hypothetical protein